MFLIEIFTALIFNHVEFQPIKMQWIKMQAWLTQCIFSVVGAIQHAFCFNNI